MLRFVLLRILQTIPVLLLLSVLVFALFDSIPGDFLSEMELNPTVSREQVEALRYEFGLQEPFWKRYGLWIGQVAGGNLGYSFAQRRPALELVRERFWGTLGVAFTALLMALSLALPLGVFTALYADRWLDRVGMSLSLIGLSLPPVLSSVLLLLIAFQAGLFPLGAGLRQVLLPALTLALPSMAFFHRTLRLEMLVALGQPYVTAAAARGLPRSRVVFHAFRNAVNPLISLMGLAMGGLLSGSVVVEKVFAYPGLGALLVDSILLRDHFVVVSCVLVGALLVVAANLLADLGLAWLDPRVRYQ